MCRTVEDAAIMLSVIAGPDPMDEVTTSQPMPVPNYRDALKKDALKGARLGVPRLFQGTDTNIIAAFEFANAQPFQLFYSAFPPNRPDPPLIAHTHTHTLVLALQNIRKR